MEKKFMLTIDADLHRELKLYAALRETNMNALINQAIRKEIAKQKEEVK